MLLVRIAMRGLTGAMARGQTRLNPTECNLMVMALRSWNGEKKAPHSSLQTRVRVFLPIMYTCIQICIAQIAQRLTDIFAVCTVAYGRMWLDTPVTPATSAEQWHQHQSKLSARTDKHLPGWGSKLEIGEVRILNHLKSEYLHSLSFV